MKAATHVHVRYAAHSEQAAVPAFQFMAFDHLDYARAGIHRWDPAWRELCGSYEDLPVDAYLPAGEAYRRRRFGRFAYDAHTGALRALPDKPFFQAQAFNPLAGGIHREFAPLAPATRHNRLLGRLIGFHARHLQSSHPGLAWWKVYVHQIRIISGAAGPGRPTPEGIHRDGHYYVAQVLVNRVNAAGAQSRIYNAQRRLIARTTLTDGLDSLLVNDRAVFHEVTELHCQETGRCAYRDMLLIDFNPYDELTEG